MKILMRIKIKIKKYLGILELQEDFDDSKEKWKKASTAITEKLNRLQYDNGELKELNDFLISQFNISADLGRKEYHNNWAVLSIKGNQDYVRFIDLSQRDIREIEMFLKRFEGTNRIVDSPFKFFL
ncbi:hypothetical protein [Psychrobacillus phage Perkons]|nr:hypothetical protein [Psychrobacillus phage Perkons]